MVKTEGNKISPKIEVSWERPRIAQKEVLNLFRQKTNFSWTDPTWKSYVVIFCFANPFLTLHKKWDQNLQETANLDTFTGEILNRKLHFCAVKQSSCYWIIIKKAVKIIWFPIIWMGDEILKNHRRELKDFPVKIGMVKSCRLGFL